jgi:hypothetical protein
MNKITSIHFIIICSFCLLFSSCARHEPPKSVQAPEFPVNEYVRYSKVGNAEVSGQVFAKTTTGEVKVGAGSSVFIVPSTSYSVFMLQNCKAMYPHKCHVVHNVDHRYEGFIKKTRADKDGNYKFKNIPAGKYFIQSSVTWQALQKDYSFWEGEQLVWKRQGGVGSQSFEIKDFEIKDNMHVMPYDTAQDNSQEGRRWNRVPY